MRNEIDFCLVPEWLAMSPASSDAVRLYGILNRIGQKRAKVTPWRAELAAAMNKSTRTIDRLTKELIEIGALVVNERFGRQGEQLANEYVLRQSPPAMGHVAELFDLIEDESPGQGGVTDQSGEGDKPVAPLARHRESPGQQGVTDQSPVTNQSPPGDTAVTQNQDQKPRSKSKTSRLASHLGISNDEVKKRRREVWELLANIFGEPETRTAQSGRGRVVEELLEVGATGDEVKRRIRMFATRFPGAAVTDFALVKHWSGLKPPNLAAARAEATNTEPEKCSHGIWLIAHCEDCAAEGRYDQNGAA